LFQNWRVGAHVVISPQDSGRTTDAPSRRRRDRSPMKITLVDVPPVRALAIDGDGRPGGSEFTDAVGALYAIAYALRFALKARGVDRKVAALEGLWDQDWHWKLFIALPDEATVEDIATARGRAMTRSAVAERVRVETISEGTAVEALHVGPYATEPDTVAAMHAFAAEHGLAQSGRHHEIYLSDPRRTAPEKLRTVLRHPVAPEGRPTAAAT
jgi:hypothetical protein